MPSDVIIYTDKIAEGPTSTSIRAVLEAIGLEVGLVSVRNVNEEPYKSQHRRVTA